MLLPDDVGAALMDGVVLCHLANHICPRSVASIHVPSPAVVRTPHLQNESFFFKLLMPRVRNSHEFIGYKIFVCLAMWILFRCEFN